MSKFKLLFAESVPDKLGQLNSNVEFDKIQDTKIQAKLLAKTTVNKLNNDLIEYKPEILHITAHGSSFGEIIFQTQKNEAKPVSKNNFADFLNSYTGHLHFVMLNACESKKLAQEITKKQD